MLTLAIWTAMMLVEFVQRPYGWWEGEEEVDTPRFALHANKECFILHRISR
jgi:hypothetical protein